MDIRVEKILKAIANPVNLKILLLLTTKPSYPRELARIMGRSETDVSRRLKNLESLGLVRGYWARIEGRNVRVYTTPMGGVKVSFTAEGIKLEVEGAGYTKNVNIKVPFKGIPRPEVFVGRERELDILSSLKAPVTVLWGISGIGKTSLAAKALGDIEKMLWLQLGETDTLDYLLWRIAFFLAQHGDKSLLLGLSSTPPVPLSSLMDSMIASLSRIRPVLVLDDYHRVEEGSIGSFVRAKLVPNAGEYKVVIISRRRPRGIPYHESGRVAEIKLEGLSFSETIELIKLLKGETIGYNEAKMVYEKTGGHPLLIKLYLETGLSEHTTLDYLWREVLSDLSEREWRLVYVLAALSEPAEVELVSELANIKDPLPLLNRLKSRALVELDGFRCKLHDLVASKVSTPFRDEVLAKAAEVLEGRVDWESRVKAMKYYIKAGRPEKAADIVVKRLLEDDYSVWSHSVSYLDLLKNLAPRVRDPARLPYVLTDLARFTYRLEFDAKSARSLLEHALKTALSTGDELAEAVALIEYGFLLDDMGEPENALNALLQALSIIVRGNHPGVNRLMVGLYANIAKALASLGRLEEAIEYTRRQMDAAIATGDLFFILISKVHYASLLSLTGRLEEGRELLMEVEEEAARLGMFLLQYSTAFTLIDIADQLGDVGGIKKCLEVIESLARRLGYSFRDVNREYYKARVLELEGRVEEALNAVNEAVENAVSKESRSILPQLILMKGRLEAKLGRVIDARETLAGIGDLPRSWAYDRSCKKAVELLAGLGFEEEAEKLRGKCLQAHKA
ncbi:MAG: helix-turn-helix domain-containing protein [Desulfurococcales archaeon]|nr:helix-turn-helix domain-containing protein [Desulfurococcales archaeon]